STGTTWTVPSSPGASFDLKVVSPDLTTIGSSVESVLTFERSTVTSPAVSVLMTSFPPSAPTILPVSRSPFRNWISSAPAREARASESASAHRSERDALSRMIDPLCLSAGRNRPYFQQRVLHQRRNDGNHLEPDVPAQAVVLGLDERVVYLQRELHG